MTDPQHSARLQAIMVRTPLCVAFVDQGQFTSVSEPFNHLFAHGDDSDLSKQPTRTVFVSDASHSAVSERLQASFGSGQAMTEEVELVRRDGGRFWGKLTASPVDWQQPRGEAMWVVEDVTAARAARLAPTWTAKHDPVTELANRREFERRLSDHVGSRRNEPVSVLWLDLDKFGEIVTGMGMDTADHFLYGVGQLLQAKVRASDTVARIEKDRFAVLLPDCNQHYAEIVAEKIRAAIAAYRLRWGLHRARVKGSIGVVLLQPSLETPDSVMAAATLACGEAKATGGDCVRVFVSNGAYEAVAG
ncbi:diguanylate cyclase (GGDEF)-like protein/PAS domain S-box-containing protein [Inhella inkyongensis]|uniref:Diguanylate cyclase (GGDEF)-like protein/PAS domain S-box-containing protein n=1 Tax=Inhella inkyongensis TaxID=392593 RepID=A0A840SA88_9BURK|nr:sensor domain-containing diguanylate cyclase [Inhella inkyongensis]MBB5205300.1 diguanylate cyclase (GGDEF)-like protein/PAS domain S-box-containing protein [Inhella inkyongensis]